MDCMDVKNITSLSNSIFRFIHLISCQSTKYSGMKEFGALVGILRNLKPVLDKALHLEIPSDCQLIEVVEELDATVNEVREIAERQHLGMSKICSVLQSEPLILKVQQLCEQVYVILSKFLNPSFMIQLYSNIQEFQSSEDVLVSELIHGLLKDIRNNLMPTAEVTLKIANIVSLTTSKELLLESMALEKEKVRVAMSENREEDGNIDGIIALVAQICHSVAKLDSFGFINGLPVPSYFCCPLSLRIMLDPVIVDSGQTYERSFIQKWIDNGLRICPHTRRPLAHINLTPNYTVREMISNWCQVNVVNLLDNTHHPFSPSPALDHLGLHGGFRNSEAGDQENDVLSQCDDDKPGLSRDHRNTLDSKSKSFVNKPSSICHSKSNSISSTISSIEISSKFDEKIYMYGEVNCASTSSSSNDVDKLVENLRSPSQQVQAAAASELRNLAKHNAENRIVIANSGAIQPLVDLLYSKVKRIQEDAVTSLLNLSINDDNKTRIAEAGAIQPLVHVLSSGSEEAKENSAAALFSLSALADCKVKIGQSGAVNALADLLVHGNLRGKKDAAAALFNLSILHENKARIVQAGAVKHLIELLDPNALASGMVDKSVAILANLSAVEEGRLVIVQGGGIPLLVEILEIGSQRGKENAASVIFQLCINSKKFCSLVLQEGAVPPLIALSHSGTPRAKEKAQQILGHFRSQRDGPLSRGRRS